MLNLTRQQRAFAHAAKPIGTFHIHRNSSRDQRITGRLTGRYWNFLPIGPLDLKGKVFPFGQLGRRKELRMQRRLWITSKAGML